MSRLVVQQELSGGTKLWLETHLAFDLLVAVLIAFLGNVHVCVGHFVC